MTNKEFYGDKLLAVALENTCRKLRKAVYNENCVESNCEDCEFYTVESIEKWLNAEHVKPEPPLLKNGDGLKPGDWIMVRKNEDGVWEERQFLSYLDGWFYARKIVPDGWSEKIDRFRQARLPEDGE